MKEKEYNQLLKESYELKMEIEELEYIYPRFLEIDDFYFDRYGFGIKIKRPDRYIKFSKEYDDLIQRLKELREKLNLVDSKKEEYEKEVSSK